MRRNFIICSISVLLAGCSSYQSDLDCGVDRGIPCTSLSAISTMIDQGELPEVKKKDLKTPSSSCENGNCHERKTSNWVEMLVIRNKGDERWLIELP